MKNAGIYVRVSTEHQVQEGFSIAAQKNNLSKFAKDNNFIIYDVYSDEGISAKNVKDRPEIQRLIKDIEMGLINIVLIYKFDRLTRNISDTEDFISLIQQYEITIYTLSEGTVDVSTPQGRFVTRLKGAVAQLEREQTSERIKVAFTQKAKEGYSLCSCTPSYGYNRKKGNKIIAINSKESKIVKRIFNMYCDGYNLTRIAKTLNNEGIPTKKNGIIIKKTSQKIVAIWMPKTIRLILSNSTYIGKVRHSIGTSQYFETDGLHKPIIDQELWNKVQQKLNKAKIKPHTNMPKSDVYFCGVLICGICGKKMTTSRTIKKAKDNYRYKFNSYRCINREKGNCNAHGVSHKKVEKAFLKYLENIEDFNTINDLVIKKESDIEEKRKSIIKALTMSKKKLNEILNMFVSNIIDQKQLAYMTKETKKKRKKYKSILKKLNIESQKEALINRDYINNKICNHWKYLTDDEKYLFLLNFIEKIIIINTDKKETKIIDIIFSII